MKVQKSYFIEAFYVRWKKGVSMKYSGTLIAVNDMETSRKFYMEVLQQKIIFDIGEHVSFEGNLSLQKNYDEIVGFSKDEIVRGSKNFELYFEEEDLDDFLNKKIYPSDIELLHDVKEYEWGQRVIRFYDPDRHIIEVAESMVTVVKRFLKQGLSIEETAKRTMFSIEFVQNCL